MTVLTTNKKTSSFFIVRILCVTLPVKMLGHLGQLLDVVAPVGKVHVEVVEPDGVIVHEDVLALGPGDDLGLEGRHGEPVHPGHLADKSPSLPRVPVGRFILKKGDELERDVVIRDEVILLLGDHGTTAATSPVVSRSLSLVV